MRVCKFIFTIISSLPCLHTFWHAIPTSFYIFNVFKVLFIVFSFQSKKFVEGVPQVVQKDVSKEEAERLKTALETAGGVVELE